MKTVAYEIAEQLGWMLSDGAGAEAPCLTKSPIPNCRTPKFRAPDWYVQAVSGGLGPVGVWKGFKELYDMGFVDRVPKLACIQASGCAPMVYSFNKGLKEAEPVVNPQTLITTVATGYPGLAYTYLRELILEHGGAV